MLTPVRLRRPVRGRLHILTHGIHAQTSINHGSINLLGSRSGFLVCGSASLAAAVDSL